MTNHITNDELLELRRLNALAQDAALTVEETTTAAKRAQQALQGYVYQLELNHEWVGQGPQINIFTGEAKLKEQSEEPEEEAEA